MILTSLYDWEHLTLKIWTLYHKYTKTESVQSWYM